MKKHLIVDGNYVGAAIANELSMKNIAYETASIYDDIESAKFNHKYHCVYLIPAPFKDGGDPGWSINVDKIIDLARSLSFGSFIVYLSTREVEFDVMSPEVLQAREVEAYLRQIDAAIVRGPTALPTPVYSLAEFMVGVGLKQRVGVSKW
jgi:hypothetical protein